MKILGKMLMLFYYTPLQYKFNKSLYYNIAFSQYNLC